MATTTATLADATPATRDRYVDFLRALSIGVVLIGHCLRAMVIWHNGVLGGANALDAIPGIWVLTWILQVMPLFFFVGGFSNLVSWDSSVARGDGYRTFLLTRVERLMKPTLVFIGVWSGAA